MQSRAEEPRFEQPLRLVVRLTGAHHLEGGWTLPREPVKREHWMEQKSREGQGGYAEACESLQRDRRTWSQRHRPEASPRVSFARQSSSVTNDTNNLRDLIISLCAT
jgi:hypothetical protein